MSKEGWIIIVLTILIGFDKLTENISVLSDKSGIPLAFLLQLALLILVVYSLLKPLYKIYMKIEKRKRQTLNYISKHSEGLFKPIVPKNLIGKE